MGREIVYCEGCGKRLTEDDFTRGKAQDHDNRPFCSTCRPVTAPPPPPPRPEGRGTERRSGTGVVRRRGATERVPLAQPPAAPPPGSGGGSKIGLGVGGGLAVLILIIVALAKSGHEQAPPSEPPGPVGKPPPEHRPSALEVAEERLRELEAFATPSADPQAILARCEPLRATLRGTPLEARFKRVEAAAQDRLKENERALELDRALAAIRKIIAEDAAYARRAEVEALLESALKQAGPRVAEVQRLQSEYRRLWQEESKRREAAKKPAPKNWSELFVQATQRVQANDYPGAKTIYLEGLATLPEKRPEDIAQRAVYCIGLYNLACIYSVDASKLADKARAQAVNDAFKYLDWALRSDYGRFRCPCHPQTYGIGHMADDKDLEAVRSDPRYAELTKKYR
ncbi:MAG TPA: hypothetical protein VNM14_01520 [Planctomycetota bacterium]|jgi:hypothetical protein|nr:hypothetical protein [Planctomycetota bacterium]